MSNSSNAPSFNLVFEASKKITFNPLWANGTGYFNNAVKGTQAPKLMLGETVGTQDTHGRKIIVVGTGNNTNAVFFERFKEPSNMGHIIVSNMSTDLEHYLKDNGVEVGSSIKDEVLAQALMLIVSSDIENFNINTSKNNNPRIFILLNNSIRAYS